MLPIYSRLLTLLFCWRTSGVADHTSTRQENADQTITAESAGPSQHSPPHRVLKETDQLVVLPDTSSMFLGNSACQPKPSQHRGGRAIHVSITAATPPSTCLHAKAFILTTALMWWCRAFAEVQRTFPDGAARSGGRWARWIEIFAVW